MARGFPDWFTAVTAEFVAQRITASTSGWWTIDPATEVTLLKVEDKGRLIHCLLHATTHRIIYKLLADGTILRFGWDDYLDPMYFKDYFQEVGVGIGVNLTKYDTTLGRYTVMLTIPVEFQMSFQVNAYNLLGLPYNSAASLIYRRMV